MGIRDEVPLYSDLPEEAVLGKRVLVRSDMDDPIEMRLEGEIPLYRDVVSRGGRLVIMGHRRRYGKTKSLADRAPMISERLGQDVRFVSDCIGAAVDAVLESMPDGGAVLLENTRDRKDDEGYEKDPEGCGWYAERLAKNGDLLVFNAFASAHRDQASTTGVVARMESYAGPTLLVELDKLEPFKGAAGFSVAAIGGAKLKEKMAAMRLPYQVKIPGGLVLNCFLKAAGYWTGSSSTSEKDHDYTEDAARLLEEFGSAIILAKRVAIKEARGPGKRYGVKVEDGVPDGWMIVDFYIEPEMDDVLGRAERILMAGSMGLYEEGFNSATREMAGYMNRKLAEGQSLLVGADGIASADTYVGDACIGGGAGLTYLGGVLPVLEALKAKA